jgi:hypothetical protein
VIVAFPGRPEAWDFPLFLHVLGAVLLFGAVASVAILAFASLGREPVAAGVLRRIAFVTMLVVVWPSFVLMRIGAEWIRSKEFPSGATDPDWVGVGYVIADAGVLVLLVLTVLTWLAARQTKPDRPRPVTAPIAAGVTGLYLVALAVAVFAMTAKPGS